MDLHLIYGIFLLLLTLDHTTQQLTNDINSTNYGHNDGLTEENYVNGGSNFGFNNGLISTVRNRTVSLAGNLLQRLEAPRDRVVNFIKPVVKSEFSRNLTNVLNSIWNRVQGSNISLIQNPLIKTNIVGPISSTFERLKQITAKEDDLNNSNLEVVNLDDPNNSFSYSPSNKPSDLVNPRMDIMNAESSKKKVISVKLPIDKKKIKRRARYMDNNYNFISGENQISPDHIHNLFDNVRRYGMRNCFALALCESNCRPHLYSSGIFGRFRNLISRVESLSLNHEDHSYYLDARRNGNIYSNECNWCHRQYSCPYSRDYLVDQFLNQQNFN